jgi:DNA-binding NarL/FixJ family response regulator
MDAGRAVVSATHSAVRGVIGRACVDAGFTVVDGVGSAAETVAACRAMSPDLLVLDLELPDADGVDVLRELADGTPEAIIVLSDRTDGDAVLRALRFGVRGYVTKVEGLRDLATTIRRVAGGERVIARELEDGAVAALGRFARRAREGAAVASVLTARERQILHLLSEGRTMQQIATRLGISPRTVETHVRALYRKLGVRTQVQAVSRAAALGLVEL